MKQASKRLISMLLVFVMVVGLLPLSVFAEEEEAAPSGETTCTVTFDSDSGSTVESQTVAPNSTAVKPDDPTRDGYVFAGWYNGENPWNFDTDTVTGDVTLKASWTPVNPTPAPSEEPTPEPSSEPTPDPSTEPTVASWKVTFNSNGGSTVEPQTVENGTAATAPAEPTQNGYTFSGWYLGDTAYDFATAVTGNIELTAQWTPVPAPLDEVTYTVTFNANKGTGTMEAQKLTDGVGTLAENAFTYAVHDFLGWNTKADGTGTAYDDGAEITITEDITLYAQWKDTYYKTISDKKYDLAPGVVESEIVLNNAAGSRRQVAHVVEVDIQNEYTKVIPSYKGMIPKEGEYGVQIMSKQAAYAEANGYGNVVAAMNISLNWYNSDYYLQHPELVGEPLGYMILDGVQYTNSQGPTGGALTCLVINFDEKDGVTRPSDIPKTQIRSTSDPITGWEEQVIPANFDFLVKDGKNQYSENHSADPASRSFVGIKENGDIVMVMNDGRQAPYSTGFNNYEMAEFMLDMGCVYAINGDGGGSSTFLSQRPGEELKVNCKPSDGAERETTHGILVISTAPATGEFVRAVITSEEDYYTPNSTVEFTAAGMDLVGTPTEIPADAVWKLEDESFGTVENGVFISNGKEGAVTVQLVYNGNVVGTDTIYIVMPDRVVFGQTDMVVPYGKTVDLALSATYNYKNVVLKTEDVTFTLSDETLGTIEGFTFTASADGAAATAGTLTATIGEVSVTVNISLGKASEIAYDFEDGDIEGWSASTWYPQYGPKGPNGTNKDENGNYYYNGQNELGNVRLVDSNTGKVKNGQKALALECDFTQIYETGYHGLRFRCPAVDTEGAVAVGFWMYIPHDARHMEISVIADNSANTVYDNGQLFDLEEGWHYINLDLSALKAKTFNGIRIQVDDRACSSTGNYYDYITEPNLNGKFTLYIDDITVDYSTAVDDRERPVFSTPMVVNSASETSTVMTGQTISYNTVGFEVAVAEDTSKSNATGLDGGTAKAYIDGVAVNCSFSGGKIVIPNAVLADGYHTVKFSISDKMGNNAWVSGSVNVSAGINASTVKVVPQDPDADRLPIGSLYWMDVVATDIETIDQVVMTFDLNNGSQWALEGLTPAAGFTSSYSIQKDDNIATITISRTGNNTETGEAVLASFPIRTWESTITECEGYEDQTPATLVKRGIIWKKAIELELQKGVITFVEGAAPNTTGTFGMEDVLVDTEIFFTNYSRKSVVGAQAWIDAHKAAGIGWHEHSNITIESKPATCTESGYSNCGVCGECGSIVTWGQVLPATGHKYELNADGKLACANPDCGELFNGVFTDGKTYVDGVPVSDGWVEVDGVKTYYFQDGVKLTGPQTVDGAFAFFAENGTYDPKSDYSGLFTSAGKGYYAASGELTGGWIELDSVWYYFDTANYATVETLNNGYVTFEFEADGALKSGQWYHSEKGSRYYYGPTYYTGRNVADRWYEIDGKSYCFDANGYCHKGITYIVDSYDTTYVWYDFGEDGALVGKWEYTGLTQLNGYTYYVIDGVSGYGMYKIDGAYYYFASANRNAAVTNLERYCPIVNDSGLPQGTYAFGADGKMLDHTVYCEDGTLYYYVLGRKSQGTGTVELNGETWTIESSGKVLFTGTLTDASGATKQYVDGVEQYVPKNGVYDGYLYVDDVLQKRYQLVELNGDYYFVNDYDKVATNGSLYLGQNYVEGFTYPDGTPMQPGVYTFGADGKMVLKNGPVGDYFYVNGVIQKAWKMMVYEGNYYFINDYDKLAKNGSLYLGQNFVEGFTYPDGSPMQPGLYYFDADGKMVLKNGPVGDYFYVNGVRQKAWKMMVYEGNYYFINDYDKLARNGSLYLGQNFVEGFTYPDGSPMQPGLYYFDADGKMLLKNGPVGDYFYVNGVIQKAWKMMMYEGNYYFINDYDKLAKNGSLYLSETYVAGFTYPDGTPMQPGLYYFDADGKMLLKNGPVGDYFYVNGVIQKAWQLVEYEGSFYFINDYNKLAKNGSLYLSETYVAGFTAPDGTPLKAGVYYFDSDGRMLLN